MTLEALQKYSKQSVREYLSATHMGLGLIPRFTRRIFYSSFLLRPPGGISYISYISYIFIFFCAPRKGIFYLFFRLATPKRGIYLFLGWISQRIFFIFAYISLFSEPKSIYFYARTPLVNA